MNKISGRMESPLKREFDACPYCEQKILKGAMRCPACRKSLVTPEDQLATIEKLKNIEKGFNIGKLVRYILFFLVLWAVYFYFDDIRAFIYSFL